VKKLYCYTCGYALLMEKTRMAVPADRCRHFIEGKQVMSKDSAIREIKKAGKERLHGIR